MKEEQTELIGKRITVEHTTINGTIIDETQHTITIHTTKGDKRINKRGHTFHIEGTCVTGATLEGKPHERIN